MTFNSHYNVYCICHFCSYKTFLDMAKAELSPEEYERRKQLFITIEDKRKLREWNQWATKEEAV